MSENETRERERERERGGRNDGVRERERENVSENERGRERERGGGWGSVRDREREREKDITTDLVDDNPVLCRRGCLVGRLCSPTKCLLLVQHLRLTVSGDQFVRAQLKKT